jgi:hypothetical protein
MKNYILKYAIIFTVFFASCTDVIDVEVPVAAPRLVIEASIDWEKGTPGNQQVIKLSLSTPYFDNLSEEPVRGAFIKIINNQDQSETVFSDQNDGSYATNEFVPVMNQSYTLEVIYQNEIYLATETMTPVTHITNIFQSTDNGFDKNALEVNITFNDPKDETNFYLTKFQRRGDLLQTLFDVKDEFTNGNEMLIFYEKLNNDDSGEEEFEPGDVVDISLYGISNAYFNYIQLLIQQSGGAGGPFSTIPAEIKGNCINVSRSENYAFGYFRLTEVDKASYTFE